MTSISSQFKIIRDDLNSADKKLADDIEYLSGVVTDLKNSSQHSLESIAKVYGVNMADVNCMHVSMYVCMYVCIYLSICMHVCM